MSQKLNKGLTSISNENRCRVNGEEKVHLSNVNVYGTNKCMLQRRLGKSHFPQRLLDLDLGHSWGNSPDHLVLSWARCLTPHDHYHLPSSGTQTQSHTSSFTWTGILVLLHTKQQSAVWTSNTLAGHTQHKHNCFCVCTGSHLCLDLMVVK